MAAYNKRRPDRLPGRRERQFHTGSMTWTRSGVLYPVPRCGVPQLPVTTLHPPTEGAGWSNLPGFALLFHRRECTGKHVVGYPVALFNPFGLVPRPVNPEVNAALTIFFFCLR